MRPTPLPLMLALLAGLAASASGCATQQSKNADYDHALAPWQGASEESLRAKWGKPTAEEGTGSGKWLTYVVDTPNGVDAAPRVGFSIGGFGLGGGHTSVGGGVGVSAPLGADKPARPLQCTTRFLVEGGKVSSWTFEGEGCGTRE